MTAEDYGQIHSSGKADSCAKLRTNLWILPNFLVRILGRETYAFLTSSDSHVGDAMALARHDHLLDGIEASMLKTYSKTVNWSIWL